jgi:hypothetical protein
MGVAWWKSVDGLACGWPHAQLACAPPTPTPNPAPARTSGTPPARPQVSPRAEIFRRDQGLVDSLEGMQRMMRSKWVTM